MRARAERRCEKRRQTAHSECAHAIGTQYTVALAPTNSVSKGQCANCACAMTRDVCGVLVRHVPHVQSASCCRGCCLMCATYQKTKTRNDDVCQLTVQGLLMQRCALEVARSLPCARFPDRRALCAPQRQCRHYKATCRARRVRLLSRLTSRRAVPGSTQASAKMPRQRGERPSHQRSCKLLVDPTPHAPTSAYSRQASQLIWATIGTACEALSSRDDRVSGPPGSPTRQRALSRRYHTRSDVMHGIISIKWPA